MKYIIVKRPNSVNESNKSRHRSMCKKELEEAGIFLLSDCAVCQDVACNLLITNITEGSSSIESDLSSVYCGITNDLVERKQEHERNDTGGRSITMFAVQCTSSEVAARVEKYMNNKGFDIGEDKAGGNGKAEDSDYVYVYRKPV